MKGLNLIRCIIILPIYLFLQISFIIFAPIFLIMTLLGISQAILNDPLPQTFKQWMGDWKKLTFSPVVLFWLYND